MMSLSCTNNLISSCGYLHSRENLVGFKMATQNGSMSPSDLVDRKYIRYDSGVEEIPPNESEDIQAVAEMINHAQVSRLSCE